jgi:FkbM family methyltransferase
VKSTAAIGLPGGLFSKLETVEIPAARARVRSLFEPAAGGSRTLVVFGTGVLGRRIAASARDAGLDVTAASDNNPARWCADFDGVSILEPEHAVEQFGTNAVFVVAIYNPSGVVAQLRAAGCTRVATYPEFFRAFASFVPGMTGLDIPESIIASEAEIGNAYELLHDGVSRAEFEAQLVWRCSLDDAGLRAPSPFADMHFDRNVYDLSSHETIVDCGAFDGDSLRALLAKTDGEFARAYALEPDPDNRAKLEFWRRTLPQASQAAIAILPYAAADRDGTVHFDAGLGVASASSTGGSLQVACRKLDDAIPDAPTLIKMDIEGAELQALRGAARLIRDHQPVLAICAYHYNEHLWQLPMLMQELWPGYRIVLRRYAEQCWETVYYAVPPERRNLS